MDFFAVATLGVFPTPTPTDTQRAAFFCSWGLLDTAPAAVAIASRRVSWLSRFVHRKILS